MKIVSNTKIRNRAFGLFAALNLLLVVFCASSAQAQSCPSGELAYVVRDTNGKIIDPSKLDAPDFIEESVIKFTYAEADEKREGRWALGDAVRTAREKKQGNLDRETGNFYALHQWSNDGCNFKEPVIYKLTLGDKTMNLVFRFAAGQSGWGEVLLVDSLPFQQGTFEIGLPEKTDYYAPTNWRKTSDTAEKPAPIAAHHIRGRVVNAVTKKPIANAVVMFRTIPIYYGIHDDQNKSKVTTDAKGRFALENLRGDYFENITKAAVFVEHADFAVGTYAYLFEKDENVRDKKKALVSGKNTKLESQADLTIELTPLVTVSGRVVDTATGANLPDAENLPKNFMVATEYGEGGYINGSLDIPRGKADVRPQPDGTFTLKTAPGKNMFRASGKLGAKQYYLVGYKQEVEVGETGLKDLILKIERDPAEVKKAIRIN